MRQKLFCDRLPDSEQLLRSDRLIDPGTDEPCVIEPAAALQLDQLIRFKIGAEMECRLLPGARMKRLGVD